MRVSINATDDQIHIDGKPHTVDCAELRKQAIRAVQWDGEAGEIEYQRHAKFNQPIHDFRAFEGFIDKAVFHDPLAREEPPAPEFEPPPAPPDTPDVVLDHENRIRKLEGREPLTRDQWAALLKGG